MIVSNSVYHNYAKFATVFCDFVVIPQKKHPVIVTFSNRDLIGEYPKNFFIYYILCMADKLYIHTFHRIYVENFW